MTLTTAWAIQAHAAGSFIVDPSASVEFAPSITTSANNNIPLINIVAPTAAGISHNKYQKFDVGTEGVIHNNSLTGAHTSILDGGTLSANPNFSGASASTIIDEVTSSNTSSLEGAIEVYGDSASVIIANPNGISCKGCSFINAPNSALTTGAISYTTAGTITFDTSGNESSISVTGDLNGAGYGSTSVGAKNANISLVARKIILDGGIKVWNAERVDLISGSLEYNFTKGSAFGNDPNSSVTDKSPSKSITGIQIDASALSEVNAGKINILATEDGIGVHLEGQMHANASDIVINSDGDLSVLSGGQLYAVQDVSIATDKSADITNKGSMLASRNVTINAAGTFQNDGGAVRAARSIDIDAGDDVENYSQGEIIAASIDVDAVSGIDNYDSNYVGSSIIGTYQSGTFTASAGENTREAIAVGLSDAIGQIAGLTAKANGNEIEISLEPGLSDTFDFDVVTTEAGGGASDGQLISVSGTGNTRYVKIMGTPENTDIFEFRMFGDVSLTATEVRNYRNSDFYSYGNQSVNWSTDWSSSWFNTADVAARLSHKDNGVETSGWSNKALDWPSQVPSGTPRFNYTGSYARGLASTGAYYKPQTLTVSKTDLSSSYLSSELAEKVIDKDAIMFASDPFVAAKTAETNALVTTAESVVVEDQEKETESRELVEASAVALLQNADEESVVVARNPVINLPQIVNTIELETQSDTDGIIGQVMFAAEAEAIEVTADGQLNIVESTAESTQGADGSVDDDDDDPVE